MRKNNENSNKRTNVLYDTLSCKYFSDLSRYKTLSRDDEFNLWKAYKYEHNLDARNRLVTGNLRFVANIAKKYQGMGLSYSDLISEGNIGLIRAIDKFDATKGFKIISYSVWWIRQAIQEALAKRNNITSPNEEFKFETFNDNSENDEDILTENNDVNMNYDENYNNIESSFSESEVNECLGILLKQLNDTELFVVTNYYGLNNLKQITLEEIGNMLGITKERVRQINEKALKKLRCEALNNSLNKTIYN